MPTIRSRPLPTVSGAARSSTRRAAPAASRYDPYFLLPALGKTAAELASGEKNAISHRGQALRLLVEKLK